MDISPGQKKDNILQIEERYMYVCVCVCVYVCVCMCVYTHARTHSFMSFFGLTHCMWQSPDQGLNLFNYPLCKRNPGYFPFLALEIKLE